MIPNNTMIVGDGQYYSLDCYKTGVNNNVLVVGAAGSGKTRSIVTPNILQATGSYVISDPKGLLYKEYHKYLRERGYVVKKLDLIHPKQSNKYNFFEYIRTEQDIIKVSHMLCDICTGEGTHKDPFWDQSSELLLTSLIAYLVERGVASDMTMHNILSLVTACEVNENDGSSRTVLDRMMDSHQMQHPDSFAYRQYQKFRIAAGRTIRSILISLSAKLGIYDFAELNSMLKADQMDLPSIGKKKTAVFVVISDKDRSLDGIANLFYSQTMEELCKYADDHCKNGRLPVDVRFILDDFATNCVVTDFPQMISSIRSRGISTMLMLQAEGQLNVCYPNEKDTIIGNCDTYVYLGGNDLSTAESVAIRCDVPMKTVLNMPIRTSWIMRRGQEPVKVPQFNLDKYWEIAGSVEER